MLSEIQLRLARAEDVAPLIPFSRATFTDTFGHLYPAEDLRHHLETNYTAETISAAIADPAERWWVAHLGEELVGYSVAGRATLPHPAIRPIDGELKRLYVDKARKGTGLAQRMMVEAMAWLAERYQGDVYLSVFSENFRAQRFYARYGFEKVGEYGYVVGGTVDREFVYRRGR